MYIAMRAQWVELPHEGIFSRPGQCPVIAGTTEDKVDKIWTDIWAGGMINPLTVNEQLTYLIFIRSLEEKELETKEFEKMTSETVTHFLIRIPSPSPLQSNIFLAR